MTANSVAKLALGIADNQALTVLCECVATVPMIIFPRINAAHARQPAWKRPPPPPPLSRRRTDLRRRLAPRRASHGRPSRTALGRHPQRAQAVQLKLAPN
jgi:hypothetical protein